MKPLIGLNLDVNVQKPAELRLARAYCDALEQSGCTPVLIPPMNNRSLKQLLKKHLHGLVLIGGRDYSAASYGEAESELTTPLHPDREEFDLRLARLALEQKDLAVLGICGGMQLLNIVRGGTLYQDIPTEFPNPTLLHRGDGQSARHPVSLSQDSKLAKIYRATVIESVVSSHHQAAKKLGKGLRSVSTSSDGLIEAFELEGRDFVIGVQWHPERDIEANQLLFRALRKQAKRRMKR